MAYDLEEQESIDQMKAWWDRWGTPITAAVCVCCLGFAGWNGWHWWQHRQTQQAAGAYVQLQNAVMMHDEKNIDSISKGLLESFGSTVYAPLAAFSAAQAALAEGKFDAAEARLKWVIEESGRPEYDTIARVRLAGVYFDSGKLDEALKVLEGAKPEARQKAVVLDRQGDVWRAKGDLAKAREAWTAVVETAPADDPIVRLVEYKLGALPNA